MICSVNNIDIGYPSWYSFADFVLKNGGQVSFEKQLA